MYSYVNSVSELMHNIIKSNFLKGNNAVDATLGNGNDTDFLSSHFNKVYAFDIQISAIHNYSLKEQNNVVLINDSHEYIKEYIQEPIEVFVYNLGFLPGGDKQITTKSDSTIKSINAALDLLSPGGAILIAAYPGHEEGKKEADEILTFAKNLPKNTYGVMLHSFLNRDKAPMLIIIEKNEVLK